ncbi:hypothetical protein [Glutamicibacter protophormiae]|uniref:hypothetical protein n=1 Tax=Glutamicibacter protophormiae TaxID=37930 RepID=UPI003A900B87
MGHKNLDLYYRDWANHPEIGHAAQRILAYIAHRTSDDGKPPVYYGGWESMAIACGQMKGNSKVSTKQRAVRDYLSELKAAGAVVSSEQAGPGVRENYALTLGDRVTYVPEGSGRNVTWREVPRPNAGGKDPANVGGKDPANVGGKDPANVGELHTEMEGSRPPIRRGRNPRPIGNQSNSIESSNESGLAISPQARKLRVVNDPDEFEDDSPLTQQQELNRQTAELQKRYGKEMHGLPDW